MAPRHRHGPQCDQDGFILVAALWILLALATMASVASAYVSQSAVALAGKGEPLQSETLITAGLELAAYQLSSPAAGGRPTRGAFRFRLANAEAAVEFVSEAACIDLNAAPKAMIVGLFAVLGARAEAAEQYAQRVIEWRNAPKSNAEDSEVSLYRAAGLGYAPRRAPFNHVEELWLVLGLPPALVERAMPFVTIYSGRRDVNVLDAPAEVIAALPGMSPGRLDAFLNQRDTLPPDQEFIARALGDRQAGATTKGSDAYRVRILMTFADRRRKMAEVVIMFMERSVGDPYRVLSWLNEIDPATGARGPGAN